jgi:hypothetical protein
LVTGEIAMSSSPFDANPAFGKLSEDARKAVTQAFDAMSDWRNQVSQMSEKNSNAVFDKMSEAAKSLGWPTDFVELSRKQIQGATKLQEQVIDQVMDVWQKQLTSLGNGASMPNFPNFSGGPSMGDMRFPGFPDLGSFGSSPMAPLQMWMQAAEMWQKSWQQAMNSWMEAQQNLVNKSGGSKFR